jgi:uncharacterized membrane-anchored protein YitT (DUF2179 family)
MTKRQYRLVEYSSIIIGSALTALGIALFTAPAKIVGGGASGIATILFHLKGWDIGLVTLAINIPLFFLGMKVFGNTYGIRSLIGTILLSGFISLFDRLTGYQSALDLSKNSNYLLSALFGAALQGVGIGLVIRGGSNTGGTDIIAQILARFTFLTQGLAMFIVDGIIIAVSAVYFGLESALYGVLCAYISTLMMDKIILSLGTNKEKTAFIISQHPEGIEKAIMEKLGHGGTIFTARGMYTKAERPVIMSVITNHEVGNLTKIVHQEDPKAFMIIQDAFEVLGEGFTPIEEATWDDEHDVTQKPIAPKAGKDSTSPRSSS